MGRLLRDALPVDESRVALSVLRRRRAPGPTARRLRIRRRPQQRQTPQSVHASSIVSARNPQYFLARIPSSSTLKRNEWRRP